MFKYSSEDCELIIAIKETENLSEAALFLKRDISVISRKVTKLKQETNLIEKKNGRWFLTLSGERLYNWSKKAMFEQNNVEEQNTIIRIGTTREFSSRILIPNLHKLKLKNFAIEIITSDGESEQNLLLKKIDIAIDCGTPYHPDIRFKKIVKEKMMLISSKKYFQKIKKLEDANYLHYHRNDLLELQEELGIKLIPKYTFNDLGSLKAAINNHLGFALIPYYVVESELKKNEFHDWGIEFKSPMSFGVWWNKDFENALLKEELTTFLKKVYLG